MKLGVGAFCAINTIADSLSVRKNLNVSFEMNAVNKQPPTREPDADLYNIHEIRQTGPILHVKLNFGPCGVR